MAGITFDELWEELKTENEESRAFFQTAEDMAKVINRLSEERIRQGLTQRELEKRCGLKQSAIARLESMKSIPRLDTVMKVAAALKLELQLVEVAAVTDVVCIDTRDTFQFRLKPENGYHYNRFNRYQPALAQ